MRKELEELRKEFNERLDNLMPKSVVYEVGKWYKSIVDKSIYRVTEFNGIGQLGENYGFNYNGDWMKLGKVTFDRDTAKEVRQATPSEVKEALTNEAVKSGLVKGGRFKRLHLHEFINTFKTDYYKFDESENKLYLDGFLIFDNGKWATIIKDKTIDEWADEFGNYALISNLQIEQDFKNFILNHKFILPCTK